jgi:hypothetical protein
MNDCRRMAEPAEIPANALRKVEYEAAEEQQESGVIRVVFDGDDLWGNILGVVADGVDNDAPA